MPGIRQDNAFGGDFRFGVNTERTRDGGFIVISLAAIEDELRREKDERNVSRKFGEAGGHIDIHFAGERRVGLAGGTLAERRAMNDELRRLRAEKRSNRRKIGQINFSAGETDDAVTGGRRLQQIITDESASAGDPDREHEGDRSINEPLHQALVGVDATVAKKGPVGAGDIDFCKINGGNQRFFLVHAGLGK